jgi:hypothetical protein
MKQILLSGFWPSHSIELNVEGFYVNGYKINIKSAIQYWMLAIR